MSSYITAENILVFCEGNLAICFSFPFIFIHVFWSLNFGTVPLVWCSCKTWRVVCMGKTRLDIKNLDQFRVTVLCCNSGRLLHYHLNSKTVCWLHEFVWYLVWNTENVHSRTSPSWLRFMHNRLPAASINNHFFNGITFMFFFICLRKNRKSKLVLWGALFFLLSGLF